MQALTVVALVVGAFALARALWGLILLLRFMHGARVRMMPKSDTPPISVLKPLYGSEPGLEENLVATLRQNYPEFEMLALHERVDDEALQAVDAAAAQVPDVPVRKIAGREDAANPKVAVLMRGEREARFDILAQSDSDVRPDPLFLRDIAIGLEDADVVSFAPVMFGMKTFGARLMAALVNTDGLTAILMANGQITTGTTIAVRREALERIGGYGAVADAMADDYALGVALKRAGCKMRLAKRAARLYTPGAGFLDTLRWVARWSRTVRGAAPWIHLATLPAAIAPLLLLCAATRSSLRLLAAITLIRIVVSFCVDIRFCWDRSMARGLMYLPLMWVMEPLGWLLGYLGSTVTWRGRRYKIKGGRATLVDA